MQSIPDNAPLEEVAHYFGLLSEPTRLKILSTLCPGERTVNSIVDDLDTSQANVSRQLNMLYQSKILARRKEGTQVYYRIRDPHTIALCRSLCRRKVIAMRSETDGCEYDSCRLHDNRCSVGGVECRWQLSGEDILAA